MADADNRLVLDTTGNAILASLNVQNGLLAQMVRNNAVSTEVSWDEVKHIAKSGQADKAFSVGDQLVVKLTDGSNVYDDPWDVTGFANVRNKVGDVVPGMFLQQHYTLPFATSFDAREAFYVAGESGLPAGTYNVTLGYSQGTMVKGKTYQFTLADPLVKGNQLLCLGHTAGNLAKIMKLDFQRQRIPAEIGVLQSPHQLHCRMVQLYNDG